jgi:dolichol-phosphate mannosyltransferase
MQVLIGIPAYNEEAGIVNVLQSIKRYKMVSRYNVQVLVVDDGSSDRTAEIVQDYAERHTYISLLKHPENKGLGEAIKTILDYAINKLEDEDVLVTMDADNTHNPFLIESMVEKLSNSDLDLVVASRFTDGGCEIGLGALRKLYSRGAMLFFKIFFPIKGLNDYSSGFRAYKIATLKKALAKWGQLVTTNGFDCMAEIAAKFSQMGIKAAEVPLVLNYDQKEGESKMQVGKTIKGYFSLLAKVR